MGRFSFLLCNICKRTFFDKLLLKYSTKKSWDSLNNTNVEDAQKKISKIHKKPNGHVYWDDSNMMEGGYLYDLSIIVPFYNTEKFARKCIDSIIGQETHFDVQIILVDDGSPDDCGIICDEYAQKYSRIKVIHKENGGLSDARNVGIKNADGRYIMFVDSDDYLSNNAVEVLMSNAIENSADIVEGSYSEFRNSGKSKEYRHVTSIQSNGCNMFGFAWGKVFRASLFDSICFPVGYWFEDTIIPALIYPVAEVTVTLSDVVYNYYINDKGITRQSRTNPKSIDTYYIFEELLDFCDRSDFDYRKYWGNSIIWQLSEYVYKRCQYIGDDNMKSLFVLCANLTNDYGILEDDRISQYSGWPREVCESFKYEQYDRWKLASMMI